MLAGFSFRKLYLLARDCASMSQAKQILAQVFQNGIFNLPSCVSAIISYSATSPQPDLHLATLLLAYLEQPTAFAYNSIIRGFTNTNHPTQAFLFYLQMNREKPMCDNFTFPFVAKACALLLAVETGRAVHGQVLRIGFCSDPFIRSSLVKMYAEFGDTDTAREIFDETTARDSVLWNSMISGYLDCGLLEPARDLFEKMPNKKVETFNAMMGGYVKLGRLENARQVFENMTQRDVVSWNTMIGATARSGSVEAARKLFSDAPERNISTWSAIISGFTQSSQFQASLEMFKEMLAEELRPGQAILVSVISSCAHLGALEQGGWVHNFIEKLGIELDDILGSSLIDMYAKCGNLHGAILVFDKIGKKDVCSWTALIYGHAIHGHSLKALELFSEMEKMGTRPNAITFIAVLCACSHAGLVNVGKEVFSRMDQVYNIKPSIEHFTCLVDLLSRANLLEEALDLIKRMPMDPDASLLGALLSGFKMHGRSWTGSELWGKQLPQLGRLDLSGSASYVLMSNLYASLKQWDEVAQMRKVMAGMGVKKIPGCSSIDVDNVVHEFLAGGSIHPESTRIYEMLYQIYREMGLQDI
ncbi:hypothetical protein H6P81_013026 [Aristolochia fimbriata]|uniref:Chlororespiratory reduction 4 n=1 Tax=Aristolochia fimbriata TaxID=158543 RepID=A0AAV7EI56_ARIFI|nr:hypothetical protein H6P81_013026 [Aristolochia fimbriata]